jgi:photosystem II stability/assembly factor-like uncharacterized protein
MLSRFLFSQVESDRVGNEFRVRRGSAFLLLTLSATALAQSQVSIVEINPDWSTGDATTPNAASGGRVHNLAGTASDNRTFYAASEWGGLFKSTDGGQRWNRLDRHVPVATWDVKVDPFNSNRVVATSMYDGKVSSLAGINVSTNAGSTWTHPATATPPANFCLTDFAGNDIRRAEPAAFGIGFDPDNSGAIYVGTNCGLAISSDGGGTWAYVDPTPGDLADDVWDVVVHDNGIIDLCGDDGHQRSIDGGASFTTAAGAGVVGGRCSIAVSPHEANVIYVTVGNNVFESSDGGSTWTNLGTPDARRQGRVPFVATNPRSANTFDLWYGDVSLFRGGCTSNPAGGGLRCPSGRIGVANAPPPAGWNGPFTRTAGGHDDVGDILFDSTAAANTACPVLFASDGGIYTNTNTSDPGCHTPLWEQATKTIHALWLWDLTGADQPGLETEDVYFGAQDNGSFATTDAGGSPPSWSNPECCDSFDMAADSNQVIYSICCFNGFSLLRRRNPGMAGGAQLGLNSLPADGLLPTFKFTSSLAEFGGGQYAVITQNCNTFPDGLDNNGNGIVDDIFETGGCSNVNGGDGGLHFTANASANPIVWTELGNATEPATGGFNAMCGVEVAVNNTGVPTFFVQVGRCGGVTQDQIFTFTGTNPAGNWAQINPPGNVGGFGIFAVDSDNPNRIIASHLRPAPDGPQMIMSTDGGANWTNLANLDDLMTDSGAFVYQTRSGPGPTSSYNRNGYPQPTLVEFHPSNDDVLIAGAADSGLFTSIDGGTNWRRITNPINPTEPVRHRVVEWRPYFDLLGFHWFNLERYWAKPRWLASKPHIPRPRFAYFDEDEDLSGNRVFVGSQGRGAWRISFRIAEPPAFDKCRLIPSLCGLVIMEPGVIKLNCDEPGCIKLDPVPKNCTLKYEGCPGCRPNELCPPYYHIHLNGPLDAWKIDLFDVNGERIEHKQVPTRSGMVISVRPDKVDFLENQIGDYFITFEMTEKGKPGVDYAFKTRVETGDSHYGSMPRREQ